MNSYVKALTPMLLSILVGSLTFIFAQTERGDVGKSPIDAGKNVGAPLPGGKQGRGFPPGFAEQLNLTDKQKTEIGQLHENSLMDGKSYFEQIKNADAQLKTMIDNGNFDESQARQIISSKSQASAELEIIHLRIRAAVRNILNDEQKAKLTEIESSRPEPPPGGGKLGMPPPLPPTGTANGF